MISNLEDLDLDLIDLDLKLRGSDLLRDLDLKIRRLILDLEDLEIKIKINRGHVHHQLDDRRR